MEGNYCPIFQHVIELLGRRWTGSLVRQLMGGPKRFADLSKAVPGISDRLLTERLYELEHEGLVTRAHDDDGVARYQLTARGEDLRATFDALALHSQTWAESCDIAQRPGRRVVDAFSAPTLS